LREKKNEHKIQNLEYRALKSYKIIKIFESEIHSEKVSNFLKKQNYIPFESINKILKSSKEKKLPVANIMLHKNSNQIVGFVGTLFSVKKINNTDYHYCNIHSWIVNKNHRLFSFFLISDVLKKEINLTAFTAVYTLKGLLNKLGFEKKIINEKFYLNLLPFSFKKKSLLILKDGNENNLINLIFKHDQKSEKISITGNIVRKKGFKVFKLLFSDNQNLFKENYIEILNYISKKYKIYFFCEYFMYQKDALLPLANLLQFIKKRDIFLKSTINIDKFAILNSDLAF
tara:strand:+ start:1111 stop:1968 length:858 start_codon:yes stop_codon:yes gene_type:complete